MGGRSTVQYYGYSAIEGKAETENYEKDNLPVRYSISDERYIDYTYDGLNRLIGKTLSLASPLSYSYVYKTSQRGSAYTTSLIGRENIGDSFYRYTYDELGNITNILSGTLSDSDSQSSYRRYTYDALNQLVREDNETTGETYAYIYDDYGNITQKKVYTRTFEALEGKTPKQVITYSYGVDTDAGWKKLLKSYNGEAIDYDEIGNPTTYRGATLTWDGRQLKTYSENNNQISYTYDADGLRASKTVNGATTTYQYVDGQLMYEDRNGTDIYYYYDSYGVPTAIRYYKADGTSYRFILGTNSLGDVNAIYNMSGELVVKYEYDAWGNIIAETNATGGTPTSLAQYWSEINPFRYRGYYYDAETGLYYLQSRYYDAEVGRFISSDGQISGIGGDVLGYNSYAYCQNNPVNMSDESGNWPILAAILTVVAAVVTVAKVVCTVKEVKRVQKELSSLPEPSKDITESFRETLKTNANTVKETTKNKGIVESGKQFYNKVRNKGEWDLKQLPEYQGTFQFNDLVIQGQDIGNINFGYTGKALGLPDEVLLAGAGFAQIKAGTSNFSFIMASNGDDLRDQIYIMYGIMLYNEDH